MRNITSAIALIIGLGSGYAAHPYLPSHSIKNSAVRQSETAPSHIHKVNRVIDGDTIVISLNDDFEMSVRLENIDAPEKTQAFGKQATAEVERLCLGKSVKVIGRKKGSYNRVLGQVYCDDIHLNSHLIENGYAWVYEKYNTDETLNDIQEKARAECKGIWGTQNPTPPWEYRHTSKQDKAMNIDINYTSSCPVTTASK